MTLLEEGQARRGSRRGGWPLAPPDASTPQGTTSPPSGAVDLSGQTVEVAAVWSGVEQANFQAVLDAFATKTGATVKYTSGGNDLPVLLNSRLAGGAPPDVALLSRSPAWSPSSSSGCGQGSSTGGRGRGRQRPTTRRPGSSSARSTASCTACYFKVANKSVIWYRTDEFDDAGVEPPKTWEDLDAGRKTLADSGMTPMVGARRRRLDADRLVRERLPARRPGRRSTTSWPSTRSRGPTRPWWRRSSCSATTGARPRLIQGGPAGAVQVTFTQSIADVFGEKPKSAMLFEGDFVGAEITELGKVKVGEGAKFFDWPSINGSKPAVVTAGDQAVAFKDSPAAQRAHRLPRLAGGGEDHGGQGWLHLGEQEPRPGRPTRTTSTRRSPPPWSTPNCCASTCPT